MKKGFRQYAVRTDTNEERRHISLMVAMILGRPTLLSLKDAVELAFQIADLVDERITREIEETNAEIERLMRQTGNEEADGKKETDDIQGTVGCNCNVCTEHHRRWRAKQARNDFAELKAAVEETGADVTDLRNKH
jgi:hypothetical protein